MVPGEQGDGIGMDKKYAPRSMVIYKVSFNHRSEPDNLYDIDDIDGESFVEIFSEFCNRIRGSLIDAPSGSKHVIVDNIKSMENALLVDILSGASGEHVDVVDIKSVEKSFSYDWDKASMVHTRVYASIGHSLSYGYVCIEHTSIAAGDTILFNPFKRFLSEFDHDAVVRFEPVIEPEVIENFTSVENVTIKKYIEIGDIADGLIREGDCVTVTLNHKRNLPFNMGMLKELRRDRGKATALFGLRGNLFESDESIMTIELKGERGKKGKFVFGSGLDAKVREVLSDGGEPELCDDLFVAKCEERCELATKRMGRKVQ